MKKRCSAIRSDGKCTTKSGRKGCRGVAGWTKDERKQICSVLFSEGSVSRRCALEGVGAIRAQNVLWWAFATPGVTMVGTYLGCPPVYVPPIPYGRNVNAVPWQVCTWGCPWVHVPAVPTVVMYVRCLWWVCTCSTLHSLLK